MPSTMKSFPGYGCRSVKLCMGGHLSCLFGSFRLARLLVFLGTERERHLPLEHVLEEILFLVGSPDLELGVAGGRHFDGHALPVQPALELLDHREMTAVEPV